MRRIKRMLAMLCVLIGMIGLASVGIAAQWVEIPIIAGAENDLTVKGHAYAMQMPGKHVYITGRAIFKSSSVFDRYINSVSVDVFSEDGSKNTDRAILGNDMQIAPKIVERDGMAAISFATLVPGEQTENMACRINVKSDPSPFVCASRGVKEADCYEDGNGNLVVHIRLEKPIEYDYDLAWGVIGKSGLLEWYEASVMKKGECEASIVIQSELRKGYVDSLDTIERAFADMYVHLDLDE